MQTYRSSLGQPAPSHNPGEPPVVEEVGGDPCALPLEANRTSSAVISIARRSLNLDGRGMG